MKSLLYIFIGGGTGSVLRYLLTIAIQRQTGTAFPWGTFAVNFLGCILIGVFYTLTSRIHINNDIRLMLTIGFCDGLLVINSVMAFAYDFADGIKCFLISICSRFAAVCQKFFLLLLLGVG